MRPRKKKLPKPWSKIATGPNIKRGRAIHVAVGPNTKRSRRVTQKAKAPSNVFELTGAL
jgi:hypothetical protein